MSKHRLHWGLVLPQGAHLELAGLDAAAAWRVVAEAAGQAERLGYDSIWALDRTETLPRREPQPVFDGWTTLAALSQLTERVGLGHLGLGAPLRDPALLAKRAACVDAMSGGRLALALEAEGHPPEHEAHGVTVPDLALRREGLVETIEALRRLWTEERVSAEGKHIRLDRAMSFPKPIDGQPPLYVFDEAPGRTDGAVDPGAVDGVIWHAPPEQVRAATERLVQRCETRDIDPGRVARTVLLECRIFESTRERDQWLATPYVIIFWSEHPDLYMRRNLAGTVEAVREQVKAYVDAGATRFLVWFRDYPDTTSVRRFMTEVVPALTVPSAPETAPDSLALT